MPAGRTYTPIATQILSNSTTSTVTFNSIPSTYTDLVLIINAAAATNVNNGGDITGVFNGDTGSNYSYTQMWGDGSSAQTGRGSNLTYMKFGLAQSSYPTVGRIFINNYANTTTNKTALVRRDDAGYYPVAVINLWRSNSAITSISLNITGSYAAGSTFTLYGIAAA